MNANQKFILLKIEENVKDLNDDQIIRIMFPNFIKKYLQSENPLSVKISVDELLESDNEEIFKHTMNARDMKLIPVFLFRKSHTPEVYYYNNKTKEITERKMIVSNFNDWLKFEIKFFMENDENWESDLKNIASALEATAEMTTKKGRLSYRKLTSIEISKSFLLKSLIVFDHKPDLKKELTFGLRSIYQIQNHFGKAMKPIYEYSMPLRIQGYKELEQERDAFIDLYNDTVEGMTYDWVIEFVMTIFTELWDFYEYEYPVEFQADYNQRIPNRFRAFRIYAAFCSKSII